MGMAIGIVILVFLVALTVAMGVAVGGRFRGQPVICGILSPILFILASLAAEEVCGKNAIFVGYLLFMFFGLQIVFFLADKRPRCPQCKSVVNKGAHICHACSSPLGTEGKGKKSEPSLPCPYCGKKIPASRIHSGTNKCPFCNQLFDCE